jgi:hypothetical protein
MTQSISTIAKYAPAGKNTLDFKGAIGVSANGVEGVDIRSPVYEFSETHWLSVATVDTAYKQGLFELTGTVNDDLFKGFAAGEVLFLGASGSRRSGEKWEVSFRFAASFNRIGITVGDITGVAKEGWEYMWVYYEEQEDASAHRLVKVPRCVFIEQVYYDGDFSNLDIGVL